MPRPIRKPRKAPQRKALDDIIPSTPQAVAESSKHDAVASVSQTIEKRETTRRAPSTPPSDDEFGFHEIRDIVPVVKKAARRVPSPIQIRPDTDEEQDSDELSLVPTPVPTPPPTKKPTTKPRQPLSTMDLINLLPRVQTNRSIKRKTRIHREDESDEEDVQNTRRASMKRSSKPKSGKGVIVTGGKVAKKPNTRRQRAPTPLISDDEEEDEEDDGLNSHVHDTADLDVDARKKLNQIREKFRDVDRWTMETETISSPFYSSDI